MNKQTRAIEYLEDTDNGIIAFNLFGKEVKPHEINNIENIILQDELSIADIENLGAAWGRPEWLGDIGTGEPGLYSLIQEQDKTLTFKFICGLEAIKSMTRGLA